VPDEEGAAGYKAIGYHGNRYDSNRPLANDRLIGTNHNATMTQAIMYWGSLIAFLGHGKPNRNKQQGRSLPEQRD
jgi:hypothetical protein